MNLVPQTKVRDWVCPDWDWRQANWKLKQIEESLRALGYQAFTTACEYGGHHHVAVGGVADLHVNQAVDDLGLVFCQQLIGDGAAFGGTFAIYSGSPQFVEEVLTKIGIGLWQNQSTGQAGGRVTLKEIAVTALAPDAEGGYSGDAAIGLCFVGGAAAVASANLQNFKVKNRHGVFHLDWPSKVLLWDSLASFWSQQSQSDEDFDRLLAKVEGEISRAIHRLSKPKREKEVV